MIFDLEKIKPVARNDAPIEYIEEVYQFYCKRLNDHGYECREPESFAKIAHYLSLTYMGMQHEVKQDAPVYSKPKQGIFLYGACGSGKTMAMQIFSGIFKIDLVYVDDLTKEFATRGEQGFWDYVQQFKGKDIILDDMANEREVKSYGNASPLIDFLCSRERQFKLDGTKTHGTSNVKTRDELTERYGDMITSRILGMCDFILVNALDGRLNN